MILREKQLLILLSMHTRMFRGLAVFLSLECLQGLIHRLQQALLSHWSFIRSPEILSKSYRFDDHFYHRLPRYQFMPNPDIASPSEIFVPSVLFPDGFEIEVSDNLQWEEDELAKNKILVRASNGNIGTIKILPK